jgi:MFS family permease
MSRPTQRAPTALIVLVATIVLAGLAVAAAGGIGLVLYPAYAGMGALLAIRRPRNPIGWLLIGLGWAFIGPFVPVPATAIALQTGTASSLAMFLGWWSAWSGTPGFAIFVIIMVIFPTGHLPSGRWRGLALVAIVAGVVAVLLTTLAPTISVTPRYGPTESIAIASPLAILRDVPLWAYLTEAFPYPVFFGLLIAGVVSMLVRARRATGMERQQVHWMMAALAAVTGATLLGMIAWAILGDAVRVVAWLPALGTFFLPPIAIGVAILRYRLYDIERIISRTIAYALVTAIVAAVFGGAIVLTSAALGSFAQGQTIAVAASTLVAFAVSQPVLRRVRRQVDRRFNRARYDAERTIADFSARLREEVDIATVAQDLDTTVQGAVKPASLRLWIREARS